MTSPGDPQYPPPPYQPPPQTQYPQHPPGGPSAPAPYPPAYPVLPAQPDGGAPPPNDSRRVMWIWIAGGVAAVVAVALWVVFLNRDKHPDEQKTAGRSLTAPATFGGYRKSGVDTSSTRDRLATALSSTGASREKLTNDVVIGVYTKSGGTGSGLALIGIPVNDVPKFRDELKDIGLDAAVKEFIGSLGSGLAGSGGSVNGASQSFDPGPLGGAMRCQRVTASGRDISVCGWGDRSYFTINLVFDTTSLSAAADTTRTLRNAAER